MCCVHLFIFNVLCTLIFREAHQTMVDNRKVLLERLENTEQSLNMAISKLEKQLAESEFKLKGSYEKNVKNNSDNTDNIIIVIIIIN